MNFQTQVREKRQIVKWLVWKHSHGQAGIFRVQGFQGSGTSTQSVLVANDQRRVCTLRGFNDGFKDISVV